MCCLPYNSAGSLQVDVCPICRGLVGECPWCERRAHFTEVRGFGCVHCRPDMRMTKIMVNTWVRCKGCFKLNLFTGLPFNCDRCGVLNTPAAKTETEAQ